MANRYLVGNGNRNLADSANWSLTSGGAGGAGVPTLSDTAILDGNSGTGIITINAAFSCLDFNAGGLTANLTLSGSVYSINVYSSLVDSPFLLRSMTGTSYLYFKATTLGNTITSNGATAGWNRIYFDGVGGEWINQDDWNIGSTNIYNIIGGIWNLNSKIITSTGGYTGAIGIITLGSAILTINFWNANQTVNYDTSTVILSIGTILGNASFYNLVINGSASIASLFNIYTVVTVTNTLTLTGANASNFRLLVASNTIGTPRTITVNGSIVASNVDFRDITIAGTANRDLSAITGGSGDCGGNSGITFTPAQPQYYKHLGGGTTTWKDATKWFSDSGFTTAGRVPLPQDDPNFIAGSFNAPTTLQIDCPRIGRSLNMEGVNQAVNLGTTNAIQCYGDFVCGAMIFYSNQSNSYLELLGTNNTFKFVNKIKQGVVFLRGIYNIIASMDFEYGQLAIASTVYFNDFNFDVIFWDIRNNSNVDLGNAIINVRHSSGEIYFNGNINSGGSVVIFNTNSSSLNLRLNTNRSHILNKIIISGNSTGNFDITGSHTFNEIIIDKGRKVRFTAGTTQNIKKLTAEGDAANPITITSPTAAQHTLNYTGSEIVEADYLNLSYSKATPAGKWYAGDNSVDGGNNTGWLFESAFTPWFWIW